MRRPGGTTSMAGRRAALAAGVLAVLIFGLTWGLRQHARPVPPTADLYTHLSVARHLVRGEGYLSDVAYPLSFAYPFARRLPQPLIHRMPGYGTLLVLPYLAAGCDPVRAVGAVRVMQILLVMLMIGIGSCTLWRRGSGAGIGFWLILLGTSPLLGFAVAWGQDEILAALILLMVWLHLRRGEDPRPLLVGALTGLLAMVRLELFWVPVLWWLLLVRPEEGGGLRRRLGPGFWLMFAAATAVLIPWSLRTLSLTGQPLFTLQGVAEAAKDTRTFPGYRVYQGLDPQPLSAFAIHHLDPLLRKTVRGIRFYLEDLPRLMAWPWLLVLVAGPLLAWWRRLRGHPADGSPTRGMASAVGTAVMLAIFYSPFDHSLRHLLPVLPVLSWELAAFAAGPVRPATRLATGTRAGVLVAVAMAGAVAFPCSLPGWQTAAAEAARLQPAVQAEAGRVRRAPAGVVFTAYSAVPWLADHPAVWSPLDAATAGEIRAYLHEGR